MPRPKEFEAPLFGNEFGVFGVRVVDAPGEDVGGAGSPESDPGCQSPGSV